jgi:hypothetical protein
MSGLPPSYDAAVGGHAPSINVTSAPQSTSQHNPAHSHGQHLSAFADDDSSEDEMDSHGMLHPLKDDVEARKSMDDEYRELPEGWIRCFDKKYAPLFPSLLFSDVR